jgi:hypothetical protein
LDIEDGGGGGGGDAMLETTNLKSSLAALHLAKTLLEFGVVAKPTSSPSRALMLDIKFVS